MDAVIRVAVMYTFLLLVFRLSGKRTLGESTPFDLLMLLVISETVQEALVDDDHSMTHAALLVLTFVAINVVLSVVKQKSRGFERVLEGVPMVIVERGSLLKDRMDRERIDEDDIMEAARQGHGLERLEQVRYAVLERDGKISILPER